MNEKIKVARLSVLSNALLTTGKLAVGFSMNSVSVISEGVHSGLDLLAAFIAIFAVVKSAKPADARYHYGYGKYENLSSILEAFLIIIAAVMILVNALAKLRGGGEIHNLGLGAGIMAVSAVVNFLVSRQLMRVAKKTESPALAADAWHLLTDVYTSLGVFLGVAAIYLTGITLIDPLIALAVAMLIFKAAFDLIKDSMRSILDARLPDEEERLIHQVLKEFEEEYLEYHDLRTRKAGSERYVDLHLVVPKNKSIRAVHSLCDRIEADLQKLFPGVQVIIHSEPCEVICGGPRCLREFPSDSPDCEPTSCTQVPEKRRP